MSELSRKPAQTEAAQRSFYKRTLSVLSVLLFAQIALAVFLYAGQDSYQVYKPNQYLLSTDFSRLSRIVIESDCESGKIAGKLELKKSGNVWTLPAYFNFPVSTAKLDDLFAKLKTFKKGLPVAETSASSRRFRVAQSEFARRISFYGKELVNNLESEDEKETVLYLGESPAFKQSYARIGKDDQIYIIELPASLVSSKSEDWIDRSYLELNPAFISAIENADFKLIRKGQNWQLIYSGKNVELNQAAAKLLIDPLSRVSIRSVLGKKENSDIDFKKPVLKFTLTFNNGKTRTYEFAQTQDSNTCALRVNSRTLIFGLDSWFVDSLLQLKAQDLIKASSEQRSKPKAESAADSKTERQGPGQQLLLHRAQPE